MSEKKSEEEIRCFICKKIIPEKEMGEAEMIIGPAKVTGPVKDKVFVHTYHKGVRKEVQEEYTPEGNDG
jgi:hypothetical protein